MSELVQLVKQQGEEIKYLTNLVKQLYSLVSKDKIDTTWVSEADAAAMFGYESTDWFRRKVKAAQADVTDQLHGIEYRNTNGRNYQYNRRDLIKCKNRHTHG
jgi:hypothetical protein